MKFQCPGGVGVLTPSAHLYTMATWSRVRWVTACLTSARSFAISADDVDGAKPGRSLTMSSGVIIQALILPNSGSIGGRGGFSRLLHGISPRALTASDNACVAAGVLPA